MTENLNAALAELQTQLPRISKDQTAIVPTKTGGSYKYTYADLAQVSHELLPLMGKLGLSFTSRPTLRDGRFILAYELRHSSGEMIEGEYPLPDRGTPQEIGGAITYARRYCLCSVTGAAPDDDDTDAAVATASASRRQTREVKPKETAAGDPLVGSDQQRKLQTLFGKLGMTDRTARLAYAAEVVGRPLSTATELTQREAGKVIDAAERELETPRPAKPADADAEAWPKAVPTGGGSDV